MNPAGDCLDQLDAVLKSTRAKRGLGVKPATDRPTPGKQPLDVVCPSAGQDESVQIAIQHSIFCQVGLPRKKVEGEVFERSSGRAWLRVQAGVLDLGRGPVQQIVPYGALPRFLLAFLSSHARRHHTRQIPVGDSARAFLKMIGQTSSGGDRGSLTVLKTQLQALAACRLQVGCAGRTFNGQPVEQFDAWRADDEGGKHTWPGVLVLSEPYFHDLIEHGVPLDYAALVTLRGSALALDIYMWLAYRLHCLESGELDLSWAVLKGQFGHEYANLDDFKQKFRHALTAVRKVYPRAKIEDLTGGLRLKRSPAPVSPRANGFHFNAQNQTGRLGVGQCATL